jgi:hypothetical protein
MSQTIKTTVLTNENDILIAPELAVGLPVIVDDAEVVANSESKKIILAGTPLYAAASPLEDRDAKLVITAGALTCYGLARHDIDVTDGDTNDTLLIAGYVDLSKLDSTVVALITSDIKTALPAVKFIQGVE